MGTACEEFIIHSDILKLHSTPWFNANSGRFPGNKSIIIKDTDAHTFSLVCYNAPPPNLTFEGNLFKDIEMVEKFADYLVRRIQPWPSKGSQGSYARLHTFSVKYELQELRDICLFKLIHLLHVFLICQDQTMCTMLQYYVARHIKLFLPSTKFQVQEQPTLANLLLKTLVGGL
ncbi:hypothetical protein BJY00DRAFT_306624 [Aspergillus carlsbadensis]|nr:hypothetical protein BJY00DRAFT_306624 [Aspergillus carlsbadensis]